MYDVAPTLVFDIFPQFSITIAPSTSHRPIQHHSFWSSSCFLSLHFPLITVLGMQCVCLISAVSFLLCASGGFMRIQRDSGLFLIQSLPAFPRSLFVPFS